MLSIWAVWATDASRTTRKQINLPGTLPVAVYTPLPLLMSGAIPRQIVMENRIEIILQIYPFTQTIGADQDRNQGT